MKAKGRVKSQMKLVVDRKRRHFKSGFSLLTYLVQRWDLVSLSSRLAFLIVILLMGGVQSYAQGVGISESSITPDASAILELRSTSRGFLLPRLSSASITSPTFGLLIYNGTTSGNLLSFYNGTSWNSLAPLASPTFTGTVTIPTPFTLGATSVTTTGTQFNYLNAATGTTGTTSTNLVFSTSPTLVTPNIGAATGTSLAATGAVTSSGTAGVGYASGAGGTVTQATNKSTGVTINKICGQITTSNAALNAGTEVKFTVTNSTVAATDVPVVAIQSGGTSGSYLICVSAVAAGSFDITLSNASGGNLSQAVVINFVVIKGVSN